MSDPIDPPELVTRLARPTPAIAVGIAVWVLVAVAAWVVPAWRAATPVALAGIVLGVVGFGLYRLQLRSARRGDRGAQEGLTPGAGV